MTKQQLSRFIKLRNKSEFSNNMQFEFDADACGFTSKDLGAPTKIEDRHYEWNTPHGKLIEKYGQLRLEPLAA